MLTLRSVCVSAGPADGGVPVTADQDANSGERKAQPAEVVSRCTPAPCGGRPLEYRAVLPVPAGVGIKLRL